MGSRGRNAEKRNAWAPMLESVITARLDVAPAKWTHRDSTGADDHGSALGGERIDERAPWKL